MSYWRMIWLGLMVWAIQVHAQKKLVAIDIETLQPVAGANVISKAGTMITDSLGYVSVADSCKSLSFSHVNYESRLVNLEELNDTVFLISKLLNVKEVVIFGHGPHRVLPESLKRQLRLEKTEAQLAASDPSSGGNLLSLIGYIVPKKWRTSKKEKQRKRLKEILDNY